MLKHLKKIILVFSILIIAALSFAFYSISTSRKLPPVEEHLKKLSLEMKAGPVSKEMDAFLLKDVLKKPDEKLTSLFFKSGVALGKWLKEPAKVAALLQKESEGLSALKKALLSKGCLPNRMGLTEKKPHHKPVQLFSGAKWLALEAILRAQQNKPTEAADDLLRYDGRYLHYTNHCKLSLVGAMTISASQKALRRAMSYLLRHPSLDAKVAARVVERLYAWEQVKNPIKGALITEGEYRAEMIRGLLKKMHIAQKNKKKVETMLPVTGFYYDPEHSVMMDRRMVRCQVYFASLKPHELPGKVCKFEKEITKIKGYSRWQLYLTYNAIGWILAGVAAPNLKLYQVRWYQMVPCGTARLRARLLTAIPALKKASKGKKALPAPVNAFTQKAFNPKEPASMRCEHAKTKKEFGKELPLPEAVPSEPSKENPTPKSPKAPNKR